HLSQTRIIEIQTTTREHSMKNVDDTQNIITIMHDQITKIHKLLKEVGKEDNIKKIEVYGVVIS
ncbi:9269_t:CDS:2, partial [Dentiscutata erythropus]